MTLNSENSISKNKNYLIDLSTSHTDTETYNHLIHHFCGTIVKSESELPETPKHIRVYAIGDLEQLKNKALTLLVIKELSVNYETADNPNIHCVGLGKVPLNIHNAGVYYRRFFEDDDDYFSQIESEHEFQQLTESNKQSTALRKGIYLTKIVKTETLEKAECLHFRLLRCSSNLTGPTDNFRKTDEYIVDSINDALQFDFEKETKLNHVLAQIYYNQKSDENNPKDVKAKINAHSDKTKDMANEGLIVFCTFYDKTTAKHLSPSKLDKFDLCYKKSSGLTRLLFKLKKTVKDTSLEKEFSVTLYPNSVFLIPLSTNRLYTHEIRPSVLNIDRIPIRMGYVLRSSNLEARYTNQETYIKDKGEFIKLEPMNSDSMESLRDSYYKENKTEEQVAYGRVHFSMNSGDYKKPLY